MNLVEVDKSDRYDSHETREESFGWRPCRLHVSDRIV